MVLFLYSPIGSPELYKSNSYMLYFPNQGVGLQGGLSNTPQKSPSFQQQEDNYTAEEYPNHLVQNISTQSISHPDFSNTNGYSSSTRKQRFNHRSSTAGGSLLAMSSGRGKSTGLYGASGSSILSDINSNTADRQLIRTEPFAYTEPAGGTDPGTDPVGHALPLSDGYGIIAILLSAYLFIKSRKRIAAGNLS